MQAQRYLTTDSGNVICKTNQIKGSKFIVIGGKTQIENAVEIRGDMSPDGQPIVAIGRYCFFGPSSSLIPPVREERAYPLKIGSFVYVGENSKIQAATIGSHVVIESDVQIGEFAIIKDCVVIRKGSKIPPFAVVAPHSIVDPRGRVTELPESGRPAIELYCRQLLAGLSLDPPF